MNSYERSFKRKLQDFPEDVTPGFRLIACHKGQKRIDISWGDTWEYYDLASLTKILFTVPTIMGLVDQRKLQLSKEVRHYLPWWPFKGILVKDLLRHLSGLDWWMPYYKKIDQELPRELRFVQLARMIRASKPKRVNYCIYSDLNFFVLGMLIEKVYEKPLLDAWNLLKERAGISETLNFHANNQPLYSKRAYAPTGVCETRGRILQGEVHDTNAWSLGGVAPHAGLFGRVEDVIEYGMALRKILLESRSARTSKSKAKSSDHLSIASPYTMKLFTRRAVPKSKGDWALGFMMPTPLQASCGKYFSTRSFGHTGFTGTSLWVDPKQDLVVAILSNRVHSSAKGNLFKHYRPLLHNWIVEALTR